MTDVTRILSAVGQGDQQTAEQLLPLVYGELKRLAARKMDHESPGHTLQTTALVHEAYIRLVDGKSPRRWDGRRHFFAAAAEAMRRILVENARRRLGPCHGGDRSRVPLSQADQALAGERSGRLLAVHEAIEELAADAPQTADLVKLRYFAGMSLAEAAEALGISRATASRRWAYGKAHLLCSLDDGNFSKKSRSP